MEAELMARIIEVKAKDFIKKSIICRFGLPHVVVIDNSRQFGNKKFKDFCVELRIQHQLTSMAHPQLNGEVEVINKTILQGLKDCLTHAKGSWADDLYNILWAYRTTLCTPTKKLHSS